MRRAGAGSAGSGGGGAPEAHATTHKSGGTDAVKLDELAAPWVTAARKRSGPAVSKVRQRIDSDYKARRAELPAVAPATATGTAA